MKTRPKLILTIGISLFCISEIVAQNWLTAGNPSAMLEKLGTTTNYALPFITNNIEKARITTTGEFGIGLTAPASFLHILTSGSTNDDEPFRTAVPASTTSNWRMFRGGDQMANFWFGPTANSLNLNATRGPLRFASGSNSGALNESLEIVGGTGSDRGWIGIGDWSAFDPQIDLHIQGRSTSDFGIQLTNSTVGTSSTDGLRLFMDNTGAVSMYNWENNDITFGTGNTGGSLSGRMVIRGGTNFGRVGVGTNSPGAHFDVYDNVDITIGGDDIGFRVDEILQTSNVTNRAIGANVHAENGYQTIGIECNIDNTSSNTNVIMQGIYQRCRNTSTSNVSDAYNFYAQNDGACTPIRKYGFAAFMSGSGSTNTYGGYFSANSSAGNNFGVWASAPDQTCTGGTSGTPGSCSGAAGYFNGEVWASGDIYEFSDANLKDNIIAIQNASSLLSQFSPKQYTFNHQIHPNLHLPYGTRYGFIAQDVAAIAPDLVKDFNYPAEYDSAGTLLNPAFNSLGMNYTGVIPLLVAAVNEQKVIIDSLITALQSPIPVAPIDPNNVQRITLSNASSIILNQNDPNPFNESTNITYSIPVEVSVAKIIFTNTSGIIINTVVINERGSGQLEVYASDLSKGIYLYTLICDGKVVASKKMVKQ